MKKIAISVLLSIFMGMYGTKALAYDIVVKDVNGVNIYYNYINGGTELAVTYAKDDNYKSYSGSVVIPDEVTYLNRTRKVTSIGKHAFYECRSLTSVTIGNSVKSIEDGAFYLCSGLTSVEMGNSVTSIGESAFSFCWGLTSVTLPNTVTSIEGYAFSGCYGLTSVEMGNSVTSIGESAFSSCRALTSVTLPNTVTNIGGHAFNECTGLTSVHISDLEAWCKIIFSDDGSNPLCYAEHLFLNDEEIKDLVIPNTMTSIGKFVFFGCSGLTSITFPNSVTSIGKSAFTGCTGLTSITLPNGVTSIGERAFQFCSGLTSVTIPYSVTSIGRYAFEDCRSLTSVMIPNGVAIIESRAFSGCTNLTSVTIPNSVTKIEDFAFAGINFASVVSLIEEPFEIATSVFNKNTLYNATLCVPRGTIEKYKATDGWKEFVFIEEGTGGGDTPPEPSKCEKPVISYSGGKLTFSSETEGAKCYSSITDSDISSYTSNEVQLTATYNISVYAAKTGYENSETVTATLCWIDANPKTEGITGVVEIPAKAVLINSNEGILNVQGIDDDINIAVYSVSGQMVGSAKAHDNQVSLATNFKKGDIAIIKIGEKSVKVVM